MGAFQPGVKFLGAESPITCGDSQHVHDAVAIFVRCPQVGRIVGHDKHATAVEGRLCLLDHIGGLRDWCCWRVCAGSMRYPDGGGLSAEGRARREELRLQAAQMSGQGERRSMSEADYAGLITAAHHQLQDPLIVIWDNLNTPSAR
jgi:hypothetical protein